MVDDDKLKKSLKKIMPERSLLSKKAFNENLTERRYGFITRPFIKCIISIP
jgi:hypothetical protein